MEQTFTDRAHKVMQRANQEAQRFNHEYIGTEHILLGLVQEGSGVAAKVLKNFDIDRHRIRLEVEKIVLSGPAMITVGRLPLTPRARRVIEYSIAEAKNLCHSRVGTEDLLLGLLREQEGVAAQVLLNLGLTLAGARKKTVLEWCARHLPEPSWLTWQGGAVAAIARAIAAGGRWDELQVLADALEEAGCENPEVLGHCRQPGEHGRGCWVVALLLNKL
jgi:hypothetical protein